MDNDKLTVSITLDIAPDMDAKLKAHAKNERRSKAAVVRLALEAYLANLEVK